METVTYLGTTLLIIGIMLTVFSYALGLVFKKYSLANLLAIFAIVCFVVEIGATIFTIITQGRAV